MFEKFAYTTETHPIPPKQSWNLKFPSSTFFKEADDWLHIHPTVAKKTMPQKGPCKTAQYSRKGCPFTQHRTSRNCHNHPKQRPLGSGNPSQIGVAPLLAIPHHKNLIDQNAMQVSTFCKQMSACSELSPNCSSCASKLAVTWHCWWEAV